MMTRQSQCEKWNIRLTQEVEFRACLSADWRPIGRYVTPIGNKGKNHLLNPTSVTHMWPPVNRNWGLHFRDATDRSQHKYRLRYGWGGVGEGDRNIRPIQSFIWLTRFVDLHLWQFQQHWLHSLDGQIPATQSGVTSVACWWEMIWPCWQLATAWRVQSDQVLEVLADIVIANPELNVFDSVHWLVWHALQEVDPSNVLFWVRPFHMNWIEFTYKNFNTTAKLLSRDTGQK